MSAGNVRTHLHSRPFRLGCQWGEHWCPVHLEDWQHNQKRLNHICRSPRSKIVVLWSLMPLLVNATGIFPLIIWPTFKESSLTVDSLPRPKVDMRFTFLMYHKKFHKAAIAKSTTYFIYSMLWNIVKMWGYVLDKIVIFGVWGVGWMGLSVLESHNPLNCPFNEVFNWKERI